MEGNRAVVWGVHMGRPAGRVRGDSLERAEDLHRKGYIALGWPDLGDLSRLPADRDAFRSRVRGSYGEDASARSVGAAAGMLFRFVHEVQPGDVVVSPAPSGETIRVGRIVGPYIHDPTLDKEYTALRRVRWTTELPRTAFSDSARKALMVPMSLFRIRRGTEEFRRMAGTQ